MKVRLLKNEITSVATVEPLQTKPSLLPSRLGWSCGVCEFLFGAFENA